MACADSRDDAMHSETVCDGEMAYSLVKEKTLWPGWIVVTTMTTTEAEMDQITLQLEVRSEVEVPTEVEVHSEVEVRSEFMPRLHHQSLSNHLIVSPPVFETFHLLRVPFWARPGSLSGYDQDCLDYINLQVELANRLKKFSHVVNKIMRLRITFDKLRNACEENACVLTKLNEKQGCNWRELVD